MLIERQNFGLSYISLQSFPGLEKDEQRKL